MFELSLWHQIVVLVRENEFLIELIVFLLCFAKPLVLVSFFVPTSVLILSIAAFQSAGDGPFVSILLAGALGCLAGDIVSYMICWRVRHRVRRMWPFYARPGLLACTRTTIPRHSAYAIVTSKFVGPLRPITPLAAGATLMTWYSFAGASAASSLLWALAFLAPAYYGLQIFNSG